MLWSSFFVTIIANKIKVVFLPHSEPQTSSLPVPYADGDFPSSAHFIFRLSAGGACRERAALERKWRNEQPAV